VSARPGSDTAVADDDCSGRPSAGGVARRLADALRSGNGRLADRTSAFVEAVALTGFDDRASTYWSGRATLCSSLDDNELRPGLYRMVHRFTPGARRKAAYRCRLKRP
jgi:hypothetical protein